MPVEFALRPRIRLREDAPPRTPSRRARWRVPRFALPAALYWAAVGGVCYGIIRVHDAPAPEPVAELGERVPQVEQPSLSAPINDVPAVQAAPVHDEAREGAPAPSPEPSAAPSVEAAPPEPRTLGSDVSAALLAEQPSLPERVPAARQRALAQPSEQPADNLLPALHAADSLPVTAPEPAPRSVPAPRSNGSSLPSCEAAAAAAVQDMDFASSDRTADLPSDAIAGVLENGAWLSSCSLPSTTKLEVCVAIKGGRVMAATVTSRPADPALNACVKQRAAALQFPYSTRVDVARTRF